MEHSVAVHWKPVLFCSFQQGMFSSGPMSCKGSMLRERVALSPPFHDLWKSSAEAPDKTQWGETLRAALTVLWD
jgi:hypothetical protein